MSSTETRPAVSGSRPRTALSAAWTYTRVARFVGTCPAVEPGIEHWPRSKLRDQLGRPPLLWLVMVRRNGPRAGGGPTPGTPLARVSVFLARTGASTQSNGGKRGRFRVAGRYSGLPAPSAAGRFGQRVVDDAHAAVARRCADHRTDRSADKPAARTVLDHGAEGPDAGAEPFHEGRSAGTTRTFRLEQ